MQTLLTCLQCIKRIQPAKYRVTSNKVEAHNISVQNLNAASVLNALNQRKPEKQCSFQRCFRYHCSFQSDSCFMHRLLVLTDMILLKGQNVNACIFHVCFRIRQHQWPQHAGQQRQRDGSVCGGWGAGSIHHGRGRVPGGTPHPGSAQRMFQVRRKYASPGMTWCYFITGLYTTSSLVFFLLRSTNYQCKLEVSVDPPVYLLVFK